MSCNRYVSDSHPTDLHEALEKEGLEEDTLERVGQMAEAMDRPRAWLTAHAIKQFVDREEWFIREVEKGIQAADQGHLIDHAQVKAKWEAKRAAQMD